MNVRKLTVQSLMRCEEGAYSNLVQKKVLSEGEWTDRDRSFYTALFLGTLSRQISIDALLDPFLRKGTAGLDPEIRNILRTGVYQIFWMDKVPVRAAISESVELCRTFKKRSASGMVNAVLRRVSDVDRDAVLSEGDGAHRLSHLYSVHPTLAEKLLEEYREKAEDILRATLMPEDIFVRVNTFRTDADQLIQSAPGVFSGTDIRNCLKVKGSIRDIRSHIENGEVYVEGYPAQWAAAALDVRQGQKVLDLCSAPGGKTMCLAMAAGRDGAVTAVELYEHRANLVRDLAGRLNAPNVDVVCCDGTGFHTAEGYDRVLCDVPCSGYGELASKPEMRAKEYRKDGTLPQLQYRLLENGASLLKEGGKLVYSTCTLLKEENEEVVCAFLKNHPEFERCPVQSADLPDGVDFGSERKFIPEQSLPEGFYVACMRKI